MRLFSLLVRISTAVRGGAQGRDDMLPIEDWFFGFILRSSRCAAALGSKGSPCIFPRRIPSTVETQNNAVDTPNLWLAIDVLAARIGRSIRDLDHHRPSIVANVKPSMRKGHSRRE